MFPWLNFHKISEQNAISALLKNGLNQTPVDRSTQGVWVTKSLMPRRPVKAISRWASASASLVRILAKRHGRFVWHVVLKHTHHLERPRCILSMLWSVRFTGGHDRRKMLIYLGTVGGHGHDFCQVNLQKINISRGNHCPIQKQSRASKCGRLSQSETSA